MAARPTICLCMIVKDEAEVIAEGLAACRDVIDRWVICDTGSTDGTQDVVRHALAGVPGELHERPWVDFGHNRTELLGLARGAGDYLLILDADTTLELEDGAFDDLTDDAYMLRHLDDGVQYHTKRLVSGRLNWRYEGAIHEYIVSDDERTTGRIDGAVIRSRSVGAVRKDRWPRDLEILEAQLAADPTDARARFYLAQTHRDIGLHTGDDAALERACEEYRRRTELGGWEEEVYCSWRHLGMLRGRLGDWPGAADAYMAAWEARPERLEAVHDLAAGLVERGRHRAARRFTMLAANGPLPVPDDVLFVEPWIYDWGLLFQHSIAAYWCDDFDACIAACGTLLKRTDLPDAHREQTHRNLQHAVREKARRAVDPAPPAPRRWTLAGDVTAARRQP